MPRNTLNFFCHFCNLRFQNDRANYTCPRCSGTFIEERTSRREGSCTTTRMITRSQTARGVGHASHIDVSDYSVHRRRHFNRPKPLILRTINVNSHQLEVQKKCCVCFEEFNLNELLKELPCQHIYHDHCITPWLRLKRSCPLCRKKIESSHSLGASGTTNRGATNTEPSTSTKNFN